MAMPPASQQSKPVYYAGEGFDDQAPRRRGALFVLALLLPSLAVLTGLLFWYLQLEDETWTIRVDSQPPGAVVLLDTKATDFLTPAEIPLTGRDPVLVQVRAPGMSSDPLVYQLNAGRDTSLLFKLQEIQRPAAIEPIDTPVVEDQEAPELQEALLAARLGEDLEGTGAAAGRQPIAAESSRSNASVTDSGQPAATPRFNMPSISAESPAAVTQSVPPRRQAELLFGNWRDTFRLRIDEREISYENAVTLTPGPHRITVDLNRRLMLDTLLTLGPGERLQLPLPDAAHFVELRTLGARGEIVSGEEVLGHGSALLPRSRLPLEVRFLPVKGFLEPATLRLTKQSALEVEVVYIEEQTLRWNLSSELHQLQAVAAGYYMPAEGFIADRDRGPQTDGERLLLGRAFHDRRPGGSQQIEFVFYLPEGVHEQMPARLRLRVADSEDSFPMHFTDRATLTVELNGTRLADDVTLGQEPETRNWPISRTIRPGENRLVLRNTERATSASAIYSVEVELKR